MNEYQAELWQELSLEARHDQEEEDKSDEAREQKERSDEDRRVAYENNSLYDDR